MSEKKQPLKQFIDEAVENETRKMLFDVRFPKSRCSIIYDPKAPTPSIEELRDNRYVVSYAIAKTMGNTIKYEIRVERIKTLDEELHQKRIEECFNEMKDVLLKNGIGPDQFANCVGTFYKAKSCLTNEEYDDLIVRLQTYTIINPA